MLFFNLNITDILYTFVIGNTKKIKKLRLKSKDFVLTVFHKGVSMRFGETDKSVAYCEIKNVGKLSNDTTSQMSKLICLLLTEKLMIDAKQIYIEYQESERHLWGWNGVTFA